MSVTTVPIPPVEKGSLAKLWGGVALAVLIAGGAAWWGTEKAVSGACNASAFAPEGKGASAVEKTKSGLRFQVIRAGTGPKPTEADVVLVSYKGTLATGKEFDSNPRAAFPVQGLVPGFSEALKKMQRGGSYKLCIPPALGYGTQANERIPANSTLLFDVDLIDFKSMAEVQAMQQQEQMQQGAPGELPPEMVPGQ
ncbi:FKBP-type peptidyl-prolyl cis-trans isomerase [Aquisediminimonas profunda]|uniref:FKBP-type peptidyl-prolyl cis-trans isomerase n=1 Tax=Aquisediminimonas profunda TaxID=1550733 RepID=UPI001C637D7C|nr:FKBP-type peptidyl-prolyl cis-trans isomerase [Aquisediminimonas profunda]